MATALFAAVSSGDHVRAKFLLQRGVRINLRNPEGDSILVTALRIEHDRRRHKMFKWLIAKGANVMAISKASGRDLLMWASYLNRPAEAQIVLLEAGGELDLCRRDSRGFTALHYSTIHDCSGLVERLCHHMRKYDLSVDLTDAEGLTPYLLARRLGHNSCANILLEVGEACPHKGDDKTAQSQHFWETVGAIERGRKQEAEKERVVALYKQMGRLPQLRRAAWNTDNIRLVPSDNERRFITDGLTLKRHGTLAPLGVKLSSFDPDEPIIASRLEHNQPKKITHTMMISIHREFERDRFFDEKPQRDHNVAVPEALSGEKSDGGGSTVSPKLMNSLLEIASIQETDSFKQPAKEAKSRSSMVSAAHAAAFGMRLKRKMVNNKRQKVPGSAINKDHLPVIIQS